MIDRSEPGYFKRALEHVAERQRRNAAMLERNEHIIAMAKNGASIAEIMTETGMGEDYVKRIAAGYLK